MQFDFLPIFGKLAQFITACRLPNIGFSWCILGYDHVVSRNERSESWISISFISILPHLQSVPNSEDVSTETNCLQIKPQFFWLIYLPILAISPWKLPYSSGGLYKVDVSETLGTCLIWRSRSSWAISYLSLKNPPKNETVRAKKIFLGCELEGGSKEKWFYPNFIYFNDV